MTLAKRIIASFFLLLIVAAVVVTGWALWPVQLRVDAAPYEAAAGAYDVRILRDAWGVPHVYGARDPDVAFGLAWAHAEDDFATIQKVLLASRGRLAAVEGREAAPMDYMVQLTGISQRVAAHYAQDLSATTRALAEAYADGINLYAARHPQELALADLLPVTGQDVVAGFAFKMPLFYGLQRVVLELLGDERRRALALDPGERAFHLTPGPEPPLGSNAVAVAPSRSADGATRLLVNSHQPWTGPVAWYEARLKSGEGWDMAGGVFPGSPLILHGHGRSLGWASTVNQPDLADVYVLETDPRDPDRYRLDGEWRRLEVAEAEIEIRLLGRLRWTVRRELLRSVHGPVLRTGHGSYALRFVGMEEIGALEQFYRMNRAEDFESWKEAMRLQALPSLNFVYADREGNVAYFYNARFPRRAAGWDWSSYLPGDRSDLVWTEFWPFESVPQVVNPSAGVVVSANHTPFRATLDGENPDPRDFPKAHGIETRVTNRALRALELYGGDPSITREEFRRYKYDKRYAEQSDARRIVREVLERDWNGDDRMREAARVLADWRFGTEAQDRSAALGILTALPIVLASWRDVPAPEPAESFREAVDQLMRHHGRLDPPWGELNRVRRGALDLPASGGPDVLRAIETFELDPDGTFTARSGDSYVMFVEWQPDGALRSETIHQFGSATLDPRSPHYADQLPLFLEERTKVLHLDEAALRAELSREYRPAAGGS